MEIVHAEITLKNYTDEILVQQGQKKRQ